MSMRCFQGVHVAFPTGVPAHSVREGWREAKWIEWARGDLKIETSSFAVVFSATEGGKCATKSFGCMVRAQAVETGAGGELNPFIVETTDPVHNILRIELQSITDEESFCAIAHAADQENSGYKNPPRGSTSLVGQRQSLAPGPATVSDAFRQQIMDRHRDVAPLIFVGAELYGPDPHGESGSEVLLGRGAVVLLDPQEQNRLGSFELFFYDENYTAPMLRLPVGPQLRLLPTPPEGLLDGRASVGPGGRASLLRGRSLGTARPERVSLAASRRRSSAAWPGQATCFDLFSPCNEEPFGLAFDLEADARSFQRDLLVRQKLVALSLKTSRGWRTVGELQDELSRVRQMGFFAVARRLLRQILLIVFVSFSIYAAWLYLANPEKPPMDAVVAALMDAAAAATATSDYLTYFGQGTCSWVLQCPMEEVKQCLRRSEAFLELRSCVGGLVGISSFHAAPW